MNIRFLVILENLKQILIQMMIVHWYPEEFDEEYLIYFPIVF
jgi:hypothetical protein